jgi:hypothetical protein
MSYGIAMSGNNSNIEAQACAQPKLDALAERLNSNAAGIEDICTRVTALADRLLGSVPRNISGVEPKTVPEPPNAMRRLSMVEERQKSHLNDLHEAMKRLEVL